MNDLDTFFEISSQQPIRDLETQTQIQIIKKDIKAEKLKGRIQDREERKLYAKSTFKFLKIYTYIMLSILFLSGIKGKIFLCNIIGLYCFIIPEFHLSDTVLITLISTSLASIVGIFAFVMKYLFKNN